MNKTVEEIKENLVKDLKEIFNDKLDKVIIYGSYARGEDDNESDIDIMVLVNEKDEELRKFEKAENDLK
jgi:predicted nucleotidyltransferase